jgi:hypothetical protein
MGLKKVALNFIGPARMVNIVLVGVIVLAIVVEELTIVASPNHW